MTEYVLSTFVWGIVPQNFGAAGGLTIAQIQSSSNYHTLVLVDGIPLNSLGENYSDVAMVPARIIERIEVIKGAASAAWGQALGGVINVITKTPDQRKIGGIATSSYGEGATADSSIELSGTVDRLGYYFSGGYLGFKNIPQHITTDSNNAYAKLTYDLPDQGQVWGTFSHTHGNRTNLYIPSINYDLKEETKNTYIYASLGMRRKLIDNLELELTGRHTYRRVDTSDTNVSDGLSGQPVTISRDRVYGVSAKLVWRGDNNLLVAGGDYEHAKLSSSGTQDDPFTPVARNIDRWGVFINDTVTFGDLAITAGARFDRPKTTSDQFSPSLGITYKLSETTLLRGYTARGYSLWALTFDDTPAEKVWTSQIGIETTAVPYLWQKLTLFRNQMWNFTTWNENASIYESDRRMALGVEYEIRTTPVFNTSIGAGYTFTDTELSKNHDYESGVPRHTVQVALRYDDKTFRGVLTGRHIFWNTEPSSDPLFNGDYGGMIWDLHLGATLLKREERSLEVFFSGRNLFNGSQTPSNYCVYPGRWFEGGVRVRF